MCCKKVSDHPSSSTSSAKTGGRFQYDELLARSQTYPHDVGSIPGECGFEEEPFEDAQLLSRAQDYFRRNFLSMFTSMMVGLLSLMFVPSIVQVLKVTRKSDNPIKAFTRYLSTLNHVVEWYKSPVERLSSLKSVRKLHVKANQIAENNRGQGMTQFDMVVTQWAFVGPIFIFPSRVGVARTSQADLEAFAHLWYLVGHYLGIKEEFNLCRGSLNQVQAYCTAIHRLVIMPELQADDPVKRQMANHLLDGIHLLNPLVLPKPFLHFMYKTYQADIRCQYSESSGMSLRRGSLDWFMFYFMGIVFDWILVCPILGDLLRFIVNALMGLNIYLANYLKPSIIRDYKKNQKVE